jgi:hypothetical protein
MTLSGYFRGIFGVSCAEIRDTLLSCCRFLDCCLSRTIPLRWAQGIFPYYGGCYETKRLASRPAHRLERGEDSLGLHRVDAMRILTLGNPGPGRVNSLVEA